MHLCFTNIKQLTQWHKPHPSLRLSENSFFKFSGHIILLLFILFITIFCGLDYPIFSFRTVSPPLQTDSQHNFIKCWLSLSVYLFSNMPWQIYKKIKQITGIEPAFPAWEAGVLPMNHICIGFIISLILENSSI